MSGCGYGCMNDFDYGNLNYPKDSCNMGGCGPPSPCGLFVGSYVPPLFLTRPCNPQYCSGYPDGASAGYEKKAAFPQDAYPSYMINESMASGCFNPPSSEKLSLHQEKSNNSNNNMNNYMNNDPYSNNNCSRGLDASQLFMGDYYNCMGKDCSGFDDVYVDFCRDVAYQDAIFQSPENYITSTYNQIYDVRGPIGGCGDSPCSGTAFGVNYEGIRVGAPQASVVPIGAGMTDRGVADMAAVKSYSVNY